MTLSPRVKLLLLCALFALPIVASFTVYHFFPPPGGTSYGELLTPRPVTDQPFNRLEAPALQLTQLRGRWLLVASDSGACPASCIEKLTTMRQVRLALGRKAARVERVFVVDDVQAVSPQVATLFAGTHVVITPVGLSLPLGAANDRAHIYLVDPRGFVMMRFPANAERKPMLKDLERLLKASQIG